MKWERTAAAVSSASPERVWRRLLDGRRWSDWYGGVQWMVVEGDLAPGTLLTMKARGAPQTAFRIEEIVADRRLAVRITFGPVASLRLTWTIEPQATGSRIEAAVAIDGPAAGPLLDKRAAKIAAAMPANLERLATLAADE